MVGLRPPAQAGGTRSNLYADRIAHLEARQGLPQGLRRRC